MDLGYQQEGLMTGLVELKYRSSDLGRSLPTISITFEVVVEEPLQVVLAFG